MNEPVAGKLAVGFFYALTKVISHNETYLLDLPSRSV